MRVAGNMRGARINGRGGVVVWRGGLTNSPAKCGPVMDGLRAGLEAACRVTTAAPVLEAVGSTRPARWFRRPVCGPEEQ